MQAVALLVPCSRTSLRSRSCSVVQSLCSGTNHSPTAEFPRCLEDILGTQMRDVLSILIPTVSTHAVIPTALLPSPVAEGPGTHSPTLTQRNTHLQHTPPPVQPASPHPKLTTGRAALHRAIHTLPPGGSHPASWVPGPAVHTRCCSTLPPAAIHLRSVTTPG